MELIPVVNGFDAYLASSPVLDFDAPELLAEVERIRKQAADDETRARLAFELARDGVSHSLDLGGKRRVTIAASEALLHREGICYAKAHLLVALLRGLGIPAGLCYQQLLRGETPESGHLVHGLVALYLRERGRWIRLDPRGNKPGVDAQFEVERERLAFPINPELGERDYPWIFDAPHPAVLACMREAKDSLELLETLPPSLGVPVPL